MLPKSRRLSRRDFLLAKARGKSVSFQSFTVIRCPSDLSRFSVVTSSKLSKLAVTRNRLRRTIYNSLADYPGRIDAIIIPRPEALKLTPDQIKNQLHEALNS